MVADMRIVAGTAGTPEDHSRTHIDGIEEPI